MKAPDVLWAPKLRRCFHIGSPFPVLALTQRSNLHPNDWISSRTLQGVLLYISKRVSIASSF